MVYTNVKGPRDTGRSEDVRILQDQYKREDHAGRRQSIQHAISKIRNESGQTRAMREALVKAHRSGDKAEIADIHDFIKGKDKYGQR